MRRHKQIEGERIALTQGHQLNRLQQHLGKLENHAGGLQDRTAKQSTCLDDLDSRMDRLLTSACARVPTEDQIKNVEVDKDLCLTAGEVEASRRNLPDLSLSLNIPNAAQWDQYLREVDVYVTDNGISLDEDPMVQLLPPDRFADVCRRFDLDFGSSPWDSWDFGVVGLAVVVGALLDYFLVATPAAGKFRGIRQRASPVTTWIREQTGKFDPENPENRGSNWVADLTWKAKKWAEVPYDETERKKPGSGLTPRRHRLRSLGHDPVLGIVFGTMDILRGTCTFIDPDGHLNIDVNSDWHLKRKARKGGGAGDVGNMEALVMNVCHSFSDVFTPQGLPAPFLAQLQMIRANSGISLEKGGKSVSVTKLVGHMYDNGYDLRHFLTMSIVPAVAELIVRVYHTVRVVPKHQIGGKDAIRGRLKLSKMLALTHALLGASNIVKTALMGGNPTALNLAQFVVLAKRMLSLLKLAKEKDRLVQKHLENEWRDLLSSCESQCL